MKMVIWIAQDKTSCRFSALRFEEEVEVKLIITEIRERSLHMPFNFGKTKMAIGLRRRWRSGCCLCSFRPSERIHVPDHDSEVVRTKISV